ncbi:SusC/RagA family TonB-linked outer membrane protein [Mucilaginibacter roseus]|uniref:SusC/RagA family TonB-linked outer membrane protein n=1 Tax=Mucilaginibacter roseus TaxID=1528868 RepID=A0ABS8U151_9SPHI|nr:SusC/RagA family TonB-linked outer membrane protein [Mucilaginibacter roseus]MCD8739805.1 SusC/RagA family TonB-linked outer membrane protein [Mucilaginibacter roseus]
MTKRFTFLKAVLVVCCLLYLFVPYSAHAQTVITGTVVDKDNLPVPGATVREKGGTATTSTNPKGEFSIKVTTSKPVLVFTFVGFLTTETEVGNKQKLIISLKDNPQQLSEVVLIGYQKITRKKSTAAVSSLSAKEIANLPAASFDQLLQGRLSGVNVQNFSGAPGATPTVSVRGNSLVSRGYNEYNVVNSPLYVVDNVPQPTEDYVGPGTGTGANYLAGINPNDIESIDVLKDASAAAIYGSRAANGVILITTKKGLSGDPKVTINSYYGLTQRPQLRDVTLGAAERRQKMQIVNEQLTYDQKQQLPYLLTDSLNEAFNGNTNWQDLFYQTGKISNVDLGLSGGGAGNMVYRFSGGYYNEEGIIKATGFKRYTGRLNLTAHALNNKLTINPLIAYSRSDRARGNGNNASPISLGAGDMPSSLFNLSPDKKEYYLGAYQANLDKNISNQLTFNLNFALEINKHLTLTSQSSFLQTNARRDQSRSSLLQNGQGNYSYSYADAGLQASTSNFFTYNNSFGKHNLSGVAGQDILYNTFQTTTASGYNGPSDNIQVVRGFQQSKIGAGSDYQAYGLLSYYGRANYDYDSRYMLSVSARTDGSSRFGKNHKWGFFPAASAGWLISEESFMKENENNPFTLLKLRGSIGVSGSLPTNNYLQYNLYNVNNGGFEGNGGAASYNGVTAITPNFYDGAAQNSLSWERSKQWNIGTDIEIKNGKYAVSFDVYNKESSLQLFSVDLPVNTGYDLALTNSIGVRNAGFDLTVSANPLEGNFRWYTRLNLTYSRNKIMNLPNGNRDLVMSGDRFDKSHILSVGSPINAFYLYKTLGVFPTVESIPVNPYTGERYRSSNGEYGAGAFYLADLDGDYFVDLFNDGINPDKTPIGDPNPKYVGGWSNDFNYKNFSLNIFSTFTFDRDVLNLFESDRFSNSTANDAINRLAYYSTPDFSKLNIWRMPGDNAQYAKYDIGTFRYYYTGAQTFFLEKGGYFRIKSVRLSYDFRPEVLKRLGLGRLRVYGIMDNVKMFQQSKRLPDAEAVNPYGEYNGAGYPIPKKYTLGLDIQF